MNVSLIRRHRRVSATRPKLVWLPELDSDYFSKFQVYFFYHWNVFSDKKQILTKLTLPLFRHIFWGRIKKLILEKNCSIHVALFSEASDLRAHSKTDSEEKSQNPHHKMNVSQCSLSIIIYSPFSIPVLFFTMTFTNTFRENLKRQYNFAKGF